MLSEAPNPRSDRFDDTTQSRSSHVHRLVGCVRIGERRSMDGRQDGEKGKMVEIVRLLLRRGDVDMHKVDVRRHAYLGWLLYCFLFEFIINFCSKVRAILQNCERTSLRNANIDTEQIIIRIFFFADLLIDCKSCRYCNL